MSVNHRARTGSVIGISFLFSLTCRYVVCFHWNRLIEAILMSTQNILLSMLKRKSPEIIPNTIMSAAMGFFVSDSRTSSK